VYLYSLAHSKVLSTTCSIKPTSIESLDSLDSQLQLLYNPLVFILLLCSAGVDLLVAYLLLLLCCCWSWFKLKGFEEVWKLADSSSIECRLDDINYSIKMSSNPQTRRKFGHCGDFARKVKSGYVNQPNSDHRDSWCIYDFDNQKMQSRLPSHLNTQPQGQPANNYNTATTKLPKLTFQKCRKAKHYVATSSL